MAQRILVQQICDLCSKSGDTDYTTSVRITRPVVGRPLTEYEIDVCGTCSTKMLDPILSAARPVKRTYNKSKSKKAPEGRPEVDPDDMNCGFPGCDYVGPRLQSLNAHRTKAGHWGEA